MRGREKRKGENMEAYRIEETVGDAIRSMYVGGNWGRRYVSSLLDIANDYLNKNELDLAQQFVEEAKRYDDGKYKGEIEVTEFCLEIDRMFAEYDRRVQM